MLQDNDRVQDLVKLTLNGTQVLKKIGESLWSYYDLEADSKGNVYLTGTSSDPKSPMIRKFDPSGSLLWNKFFTFGSSENNYNINNIATSNGDNTYAVGSTVGPVNGANHGGSDAFIVRLNAQEQQVLGTLKNDHPKQIEALIC